ncbi:aldehyde dehydrogenase (NADP(+)) [Gordonia soli]|uniref:Putative aldehyde dehydrogenase n=1 Tax=Gordonia soli NBRC 108243 TaxID=1223545 RepID=M0QH75_9ACTN|nr:aldehyde dehydrogenase (NADP(+)) [Gordonia soli]GAC67671.1 putative aldehyde dehydrogenase [Gordonia soli NBRC 108243]
MTSTLVTEIRSVAARTGADNGHVAPVTTADDVDETVQRAVVASRQLRDAGRDRRIELLTALADALDDSVDELVSLADVETALGAARLAGEVARSSGQLRHFVAVLVDGWYAQATIDHAEPSATPPKPDLRRHLTSIGPVAVFAASNFPFAFSVCGGDTASALAAGSAVVVKVHDGHPATSARTAEILRAAAESAGFSPDVVQLVFGRDAGISLISHPDIEAAGFTGSVPGGRALFDIASARPTPIRFFGELGSLNALIITPGAALDRGAEIAAGLAGSFTLGQGQFCTKPGVAFVPDGDAGDELIRRLVDEASTVPAGALLMPRLLDGYRASVGELVGAGEIATSLLDRSADSELGVGPTILRIDGDDLIANGAGRLLEECFGPTTVVVTYSSDRELAELVDLVPPSLTGTVHATAAESQPGAAGDRAMQALRARSGRLVWNGYPTGVAVTWAQHHGGGYPSTTDPAATSVGASAIGRFLRAVAYQDVPDALLPPELQEANPLDIVRRIDGTIVLP